MTRLPFAVLVGSGLAWGATIPLSKVSVSTGHGAFGLILWQLVIGMVLMGTICVARGRLPHLTASRVRFAVAVALMGTLLPNGASYSAYPHLPASVMALIIALVPMLSFLLAVALGRDRLAWLRAVGLALGLAGVVVVIGPGGSGPAASVVWVAVALVAPCLYACESNYVAQVGMGGMDPFQAMFLAATAGVVLCLPVTLLSGQWVDPFVVWGRAEWAVSLSSILHVFAYASYVWLAARAGATFAAQSAYVVTITAVIWSALLLDEPLTTGILLALALMLAGVALVRPREQQQAA